MDHTHEQSEAEHDAYRLEVEGWRALSSSAEEARAFYDRVLDERALMLLPEGLVLDDRTAILDSLSDTPWASYELFEPVVLEPAPNVAVVAYGVLARREGSSGYTAQASSTYVRHQDGWKLVMHQQTPR